MKLILERRYHVGASDTDPNGLCRPSGLLRYLQEIATTHARELEMPRERMVRDFGVIWVLARMWYRLDRPIRAYSDITALTWHRKPSGALFYRDFDIFEAGEPVGEAVSSWVLLDIGTRRVVRPSSLGAFGHGTHPENVKSVTLSTLALPETAPLGVRAVRYSDLDINRHMNNIRYADIICDHIYDGDTYDKYISELQINYIAECVGGEELLIRGGADGARRFISARDMGGAKRFEALAVLSDIPEC